MIYELFEYEIKYFFGPLKNVTAMSTICVNFTQRDGLNKILMVANNVNDELLCLVSAFCSAPFHVYFIVDS